MARTAKYYCKQKNSNRRWSAEQSRYVQIKFIKVNQYVLKLLIDRYLKLSPFGMKINFFEEDGHWWVEQGYIFVFLKNNFQGRTNSS